ncbi:predicted protein [Histoplasma capsulatum var. duboisii H88]|uniref:Predicted protein n=1 Tax=Ajellomyces capsulatus (strain H88) TaxID=544711 RepID=F0UJB7_AJEC8|nr:predicted protein [Histoplasma capsulatum var. duboisii H88]
MPLAVDLSHLPLKVSRQEARNRWNDQRAALVQGSLLPTTQRVSSTPSSCVLRSTSLATGYSGLRTPEVLGKPSRSQEPGARILPPTSLGSNLEPMQLLLSNFLSRQKGRNPLTRASIDTSHKPAGEAGAGINHKGRPTSASTPSGTRPKAGSALGGQRPRLSKASHQTKAVRSPPELELPRLGAILDPHPDHHLLFIFFFTFCVLFNPHQPSSSSSSSSSSSPPSSPCSVGLYSSPAVVFSSSLSTVIAPPGTAIITTLTTTSATINHHSRSVPTLHLPPVSRLLSTVGPSSSVISSYNARVLVPLSLPVTNLLSALLVSYNKREL